MKKFIATLLLSLSLLAGYSVSQAAGPYGMPGHLDGVDLKNNRLFIDDREFKLATGYTVRNRKGEVVSAFYLKKGQMLDCRLDADGKLVEITIK